MLHLSAFVNLEKTDHMAVAENCCMLSIMTSDMLLYPKPFQVAELWFSGY